MKIRNRVSFEKANKNKVNYQGVKIDNLLFGSKRQYYDTIRDGNSSTGAYDNYFFGAEVSNNTATEQNIVIEFSVPLQSQDEYSQNNCEDLLRISGVVPAKTKTRLWSPNKAKFKKNRYRLNYVNAGRD